MLVFLNETEVSEIIVVLIVCISSIPISKHGGLGWLNNLIGFDPGVLSRMRAVMPTEVLVVGKIVRVVQCPV